MDYFAYSGGSEAYYQFYHGTLIRLKFFFLVSMFVKLKGQIKIFTVKKIHFRNVFYNSYNIAMLLPKLQN